MKMNDFVKITIPAHKKLIQLVNDSKCKNLLYSVKGGGCIGFTYRAKLAKNSFQYSLAPLKYPNSYLMNSIQRKEYTLFICEYSFKHLVNSTIHWEKNFMNEKFVFENPNAEFIYKCQNSFISKYD